MIYKITDEQHFQVLSDSFSVSPSETGYELYFSANGVEFSPFTTVAAGQNKQFVNMANGNYYYLSGNVGDVEVNWEKDCGGGGGGGTAGVSSLDGQTGALTTKTINGNAILGTGDIVISGAGGDSNYVIVDALSAITNPVEGMIAYVPAHNETYSGYTISNADGNLYGQVFVKQYNPREKSYMLYEQYDEGMMSFPNSSPWELGNSGIFKYAFRNQLAISYSDNDKEFVVLYKPGRFQMQIGVSQEYYSETTGTVQVPGQMYIYKYGSWHYYEDGKISYYLSTITEAEYDALYADVPTMGMSEVQFIVDDFYAGWAEYKLATITTQPSSNSVYGSGFSCGASNGETFDAINALSVRCEWSSGWKDWSLVKYSLLPTP